MSASPPRLRGYRVEEFLGAGRTGSVWRAHRVTPGIPVALKFVSTRLADVLPEAAALARLRHPNLIVARQVHRLRHASVLELDLAAGGSLAALLGRRHVLPAGEVVAALTPVAAALHAVHEAGLVHADISPANVLFGADGLPLLSDLGSAYWLDQSSTSVPAAPFADPLIAHGHLTGQAGDVYGLAAVAFTALTGRPVPLGPDGVELSRPGTEAFQRRCAAGLADVAPSLAEVVLAGLALEPASRPSALQLALGLRFAVPATGVDLQAGRHTELAPLPVITRGRGRGLPTTAGADRSRSRRRLRRRPAPRDTPPRRPSP